MNAHARNTVLVLFMWLMLTGVCLGKQVYLMDGGIIDAQSVWRQGNKVFVKVNRDIVAEFAPSEINLRRTFPKPASSSHQKRRKISVSTTAEAAEAVETARIAPIPVQAAVTPAPKPAVQNVPSAATPVSKSAAPSVPSPAVTAKEPAQPKAAPAEPADPAAAPDKAEQQRRAQEAAKMMTEAVMKKDPELMKKALEMQKNAMSQQGATAQQKAGFSLSLLLMFLVACILILAGQWIVFQRAGYAGWKCLVPFYNMFILMKIAGKPGWWMFLLFVPLVGVAILLIAMLSLAKKFGRNELFGVGLFLLPMAFFPLLAFSGSEYEE